MSSQGFPKSITDELAKTLAEYIAENYGEAYNGYEIRTTAVVVNMSGTYVIARFVVFTSQGEEFSTSCYASTTGQYKRVNLPTKIQIPGC